jgi:hypothetical protein
MGGVGWRGMGLVGEGEGRRVWVVGLWVVRGQRRVWFVVAEGDGWGGGIESVECLEPLGWWVCCDLLGVGFV